MAETEKAALTAGSIELTLANLSPILVICSSQLPSAFTEVPYSEATIRLAQGYRSRLATVAVFLPGGIIWVVLVASFGSGIDSPA